MKLIILKFNPQYQLLVINIYLEIFSNM